MDPAVRFGELISGPSESLRLDLGAALIGAAFDPPTDADVVIGDLDALASRCAPTFDSIVGTLFGTGLLQGNGREYADPRNSYLHEVLGRGLGLPITLSVVAMEVGRRLEVTVEGIGLPGHFVVGDGSGYCFADPFNGGVQYDADGLSAAWQRITGSPTEIPRDMLRPSPSRLILLRMLNNLMTTFVRRDDSQALATLARLRGAFHELADEHLQHARWMRHWN